MNTAFGWERVLLPTVFASMQPYPLSTQELAGEIPSFQQLDFEKCLRHNHRRKLIPQCSRPYWGKNKDVCSAVKLHVLRVRIREANDLAIQSKSRNARI